jgi:hypothetical protein
VAALPLVPRLVEGPRLFGAVSALGAAICRGETGHGGAVLATATSHVSFVLGMARS